jgi:hypothetical protein
VIELCLSLRGSNLGELGPQGIPRPPPCQADHGMHSDTFQMSALNPRWAQSLLVKMRTASRITL